jgi:hypothetical protein
VNVGRIQVLPVTRHGKWRIVVGVEADDDQLGNAAARLSTALRDAHFINVTIEHAEAITDRDRPERS